MLVIKSANLVLCRHSIISNGQLVDAKRRRLDIVASRDSQSFAASRRKASGGITFMVQFNILTA
jgi:hypothetical protein